MINSARMSCVVGVKVPSRVREKMRKLRENIDWPEEIRNLITEKIEEIERATNSERFERLRKQLPVRRQGTISG